MEIIVEKYNLIKKINNKISNKKIKIIRIVYKNILKKISKILLLKFIIIIIIILFNIYFIKTIYYKKKNLLLDNIKVCLCSLGKNENKHALEYIEHYKRYRVDKIFIYDNNDINGEKFENVVFEYIKNKYV